MPRATVLRLGVPAVAAAVLVAWLVADARARAHTRTDAQVRADVATAVSQVSAAVREQLERAGTTGGAGGVTVRIGALGTSGVASSSAVEARDSGRPALDDTSSPPSIVLAVYGGGRVPGTTADRRRAVTAYRVVPLVLPTVLERATDGGGGGLAVRGTAGRVVAASGTPPAGARTYSVALDVGGAAGWQLQGWLPARGPGADTALVLVLVLAGFLVLGILLRADQRRAAMLNRRQLQLVRESVLVSGLAPVVQASFDLGEVFPAASSHLGQQLDLGGLSLSAPGPTGERQLFCWGAQPDVLVKPVAAPPALLAPGRTFALSLARGGRVLGVLRVLAGAPLTATDLRALATASELLGSTLANAEAFAQQQSLVERMQAVDELKTVFLATASHELRTPVAAIVGFSQLVLGQWGRGDPEQAKAFLERVVANARALEELTEQLLDFSRLERGIKPAAGELLDLAVTTRRVLAEQPELAADHELELVLMPGCIVHGSEPAVARIVTNLVGNAAKYSPTGTRITVTVLNDGERVSLLVDDEGPGVPEADRERIFARFYRGGSDGVASTRGTGVGLAIVAEFAASMSGTAQAQQAPSGGARFCVTFPAADGDVAAQYEGETHVQLA